MSSVETQDEPQIHQLIIEEQRQCAIEAMKGSDAMVRCGFMPMMLAVENIVFFENMGFAYGRNRDGSLGLFLDQGIFTDLGGCAPASRLKK